MSVCAMCVCCVCVASVFVCVAGAEIQANLWETVCVAK